MNRDLKLNVDKHVGVDGEGDLATTSGVETIEQSIAINLSEPAQEVIGNRTSGATIERFESRISELPAVDEAVSRVVDVSVEQIDTRDNTIAVAVRALSDEDVLLEVSV
jgi:hypothetical protein